jgi:hypothetical protein
MLISAFTRTQIAALFGTAILKAFTASYPSHDRLRVSDIEGQGQCHHRLIPAPHFHYVSTT